MPTSCSSPGEGLRTELFAESWLGSTTTATWTTHAASDPASPLGTSGCGFVPLQTERHRPAKRSPDPGPQRPCVRIAGPHRRPAQRRRHRPVGDPPRRGNFAQRGNGQPRPGLGLGACSEAQYKSTELSIFATSGGGCPSDSKIGTVEVRTPLLEEAIEGEVFVAEPYANPFGSLIALYVVVESPERGILVKLAGRVNLDPHSGQIHASFDELPQLPLSSVKFRFREGARAPLVTTIRLRHLHHRSQIQPLVGG